jgi:hypothetical protein
MAEKANKEGNNVEVDGKLRAKNYLMKIFNIADALATFRIRVINIKHYEIGQKLAMPREWFERMQAQAYPSFRLVSFEEMLKAQLEIVLAKMLLVYERLNNFYM